MRLVNMETATFLVCAKGLDTESFFIQATGFLGCGHSADHIQRLVIPLGPTTQHHDGAIRLSGAVDLRPRSWDRPLYAFRGGLRGAGASSTDANIAINFERGC